MTVTLAGAGKYFADLVARSRAAAVQALRRAAVDLQAEAVRQVGLVAPYPPVDTGAMRRSFLVSPTPDGAVVENTAPQAVWMEYGTRPHWAPIAPLLAWATRKARGGNIRSVYALAKGAQKSIAARGTAPRHFWQATLALAPAIIDTRVREALARVS